MSDCWTHTHLPGVSHDGPCIFIPGDDPAILKPVDPPPPPGMTATALAAYVDAFVRAATIRVLGVGAEQYDQGDGQRFEGMPLAELLDWTSEELQDVAVYAAMLDIRIRRIKAELEGRDV